jgi:hypothetical protein
MTYDALTYENPDFECSVSDEFSNEIYVVAPIFDPEIRLEWIDSLNVTASRKKQLILFIQEKSVENRHGR